MNLIGSENLNVKVNANGMPIIITIPTKAHINVKKGRAFSPTFFFK